MTEIYDLMQDLAQAVARDESLGAWCLANFGATVQVHIDEDQRDPDGNAPAVRFHSPWKRAAEDRRQVESGMYLYLLVNASADALGPDINLDEFAATGAMMQFVGYVLAAVRGAKPAAAVMEYDLQTDTITNFPFFEADIALQFTEAVTIGSDPLNDY